MHQMLGVGLGALQKKFPKYTRITLYRHSKKKVGDVDKPVDKRSRNGGRPKKLSDRDERAILRSLHSLRESVGTFSSREIQEHCGLLSTASNRTIRRCLNENKYGYFQCRRKGLLTKEDLVKPLKFARKCKRLPANFWTEGVSFYLDGTGWVHKTDPCKQAKTRRTRM